MKQSIVFTLIILNCIISYAQQEGDIIEISVTIKVLKTENIVLLQGDTQEEVDELLTETTQDLPKYYLDKGFYFSVLEINIDSVKLMANAFKEVRCEKFLRSEEKEKKCEEQKQDNIEDSLYRNKIFTISRIDFETKTDIYKKKDKISLGLLSLPFKARPQDKWSFDTEFNLSTTLSWNMTDFYEGNLYLQLGIGIGSVQLNPVNSNGLSGEASQDVSALNLFGGVMIDYKKIQVGLYAGVDQINNQEYYQWKSNGNLWLGFGIGYNIFTISKKEVLN